MMLMPVDKFVQKSTPKTHLVFVEKLCTIPLGPVATPTPLPRAPRAMHLISNRHLHDALLGGGRTAQRNSRPARLLRVAPAITVSPPWLPEGNGCCNHRQPNCRRGMRGSPTGV